MCECYWALPIDVRVAQYLCCVPHYCVCEIHLANGPNTRMTSTKRTLTQRSLSAGEEEMNRDKRQHFSSTPTKSQQQQLRQQQQQQQQPSANAGTSSGDPLGDNPQTKTPVKDEGDGDEVEDFDDGTLHNMSVEVTGGQENVENGAAGGSQPSSFAEAVKKQTKNLYPYALYIQKGKERREPITRAHFKSFEENLFNARMQLSFEDNQKINIDWIAYRDGHGVVTTMDQHSAAFVKGLAAEFQFKTESGTVHTRGWSRWERSDQWVIQAFFHGQIWRDPKKKPKHLLAQVLKMNNIPAGEFEILSWDCKNNMHGAFVCFCPSGGLIGELLNRKKLMAPQCTIVLQHRLRKKRTEAEFIAIQEQQQSKKVASPAILRKAV